MCKTMLILFKAYRTLLAYHLEHGEIYDGNQLPVAGTLGRSALDVPRDPRMSLCCFRSVTSKPHRLAEGHGY
jgi:hypothetical protein